MRDASMASIGASFRRRSASVSRPCRALTPKPRAEAAPITTYWSSASQRWARTDVGIRNGSPLKMVVERGGEASQPCRAISPRCRPPFVLVDSPAAQPLHTRVHRAGGAMHTPREHPNGRFRPVLNVSFLVIYCQQAKDGLDQKWQPVEDGGAEREVVRRHSPAEPSARDVDLNGWIRG